MSEFPIEHVVGRCREIVGASKDDGIRKRLERVDIGLGNFLDVADVVRDIIQHEWSGAERERPWVLGFCRGLRELRDDLEAMVAADPMLMYNPGIQKAFEFHRSLAKIRYWHSGNRCRKSQSAAADNYWILTGSHPYRPMPPQPASVLVVGPDYSTYCPEVYEKKYLLGETGNILSPIFPVGGKWFYSYNGSTKQFKIACAACARAGKGGSCPHPKATLSFASGEGEVKAISGGQHGQIQFDEQIKEDFKNEALERLKTVPRSSFIVTETPLMGEAFWTYDLKLLADGPKERNRIPGTDVPYIEAFNVSQYEGGLVDVADIEASKLSMTEEEIAVRIYGRHVSFGANKVFNLGQVNRYMQTLRIPTRGHLSLGESSPDDLTVKLAAVDAHGELPKLTLLPDEEGPYYFYEEPNPLSQYLVTVDTAAGLAGADACVARAWEMVPKEEGVIALREAAKFTEQVNPVPFARHIYKLALHYNAAIIVVERNHSGVATIYELVETLNCPLLYRKQTHLAQVDYAEDRVYGVDTTVATKPAMVAHAQRMVYAHDTGTSLVDIWDRELVKQMQYYIEEPTPTGMTIRYKGQGKTHDDEVTTLLLAAFVVRTAYMVYDWDRHNRLREVEITRTFKSRDEKYKWAITQISRGKRTGIPQFDELLDGNEDLSK